MRKLEEEDDDFATESRGRKSCESIKQLKSALRDKIGRLSVAQDEKRHSAGNGAGKPHGPTAEFSSLASNGPSQLPESRARVPMAPPRGISGDLQALGRATQAQPKEYHIEQIPSRERRKSRVLTKLPFGNESPTASATPSVSVRSAPSTAPVVPGIVQHPPEEPLAFGKTKSLSEKLARSRQGEKEKLQSPMAVQKIASFAGTTSFTGTTSSTTSSPTRAGTREKRIRELRKAKTAGQKLKEEEELMADRVNTHRGGLIAEWKRGDDEEESTSKRMAAATALAPGFSMQWVRNCLRKPEETAAKAEGEKYAQMWELSKEMAIPLQNIKVARDIFDTIDQNRSGNITPEEFQKWVGEVTLKDGNENALGFLNENVNQDGSMNFRTFLSWYSSNGFNENIVLDKTQKEIRDIARRSGLPLVEVESIKRMFDSFDSDGSGEIEIEEFTKILYKLLKVPTNLELPASRVRAFWSEIDCDGSGDVNFEEFLLWYKRYFDRTINGQRQSGTNSSPIEWFYKSIRTTGM